MGERISIFDFLLDVKLKFIWDIREKVICNIFIKILKSIGQKWSSRFDQLQVSIFLASSSDVIILCIKIDILYRFSSTH